jgi:hypothetical protein
MPKSVLTLMAVLISTAPGYSASSYVSWEFRGVVTESGKALAPVGSWYSFEYSFNPMNIWMQYPPLEHSALYSRGSLNFDLLSTHVGYSGAALSLQVMNDLPMSGEVADALWFKYSWSGEPQLDGRDLGITLFNRVPGASAAPLTSTAYPVALDLNDYSERHMSMDWPGAILGSVDQFYINGVLVSEVIPEPGTVSLVGMGALCVVLLPATMKRRTEMETGMFRW